MLGEAPVEQFRTFAGDIVSNAWETIFPIVSTMSDGHLRLIGTGFFIARGGIFVTAKHVLLDVLTPDMKQRAPIGLLQLLPEDKVVVRPILRCVWHTVADVAVGVAAVMTSRETGAKLANKVIVLTSKHYDRGVPVFTYAYPKSEFRRTNIHLHPAFFDGHIEQFYPNGRDKSMLPGRCYQTSMFIHGGASGGPVFGPDGTAIGINSSGYDGEALSFVSMVEDILDLYVSDVVVDKESASRDVSVRELTRLGVVKFRPTVE